MMDHGGFSLSNLFQGPSLALLTLYIVVLALLGVLSFSFRGAIVV